MYNLFDSIVQCVSAVSATVVVPGNGRFQQYTRSFDLRYDGNIIINISTKMTTSSLEDRSAKVYSTLLLTREAKNEAAQQANKEKMVPQFVGKITYLGHGH